MPESRRPLGSFTLVHLFVLIGVICLVLALVVPAIQQAREAARQMSCQNNLKQLCLGVHNFGDTYRHLPAALGGTNLPGGPLESNLGRRSGVVALLPFLESSPLPDQIASLLTTDKTTYPPHGPAPWIADYPPWRLKFEAFNCPSAEWEPSELGQTNYAFCIGDLARDIHQPAKLRGIFGGGLTCSFDDVTDGLSNTILIGEIGTRQGRAIVGQYAVNVSADILDNPSLHAQYRASPRSGQYAKSYSLSKYGRGGRWADGSAGDSQFNTILPPNSPSCAVEGDEAVDGLYSLGSYHPGGAHIVLADGSVRFIANVVDCGDLTQPTLTTEQMSGEAVASPYGVWGALGTMASGEEIPY